MKRPGPVVDLTAGKMDFHDDDWFPKEPNLGYEARGESGVLTCSALKRAYRAIIVGHRPDVQLVYLRGSYDLIHRRLLACHEHFMPVALLDSQFAALAEPTPAERPIVVDIGPSAEDRNVRA